MPTADNEATAAIWRQNRAAAGGTSGTAAVRHNASDPRTRLSGGDTQPSRSGPTGPFWLTRNQAAAATANTITAGRNVAAVMVLKLARAGGLPVVIRPTPYRQAEPLGSHRTVHICRSDCPGVPMARWASKLPGHAPPPRPPGRSAYPASGNETDGATGRASVWAVRVTFACR